jgi:hypothetical protein
MVSGFTYFFIEQIHAMKRNLSYNGIFSYSHGDEINSVLSRGQNKSKRLAEAYLLSYIP